MERPEPTRVEHLSGTYLSEMFLALPEKINLDRNVSSLPKWSNFQALPTRAGSRPYLQKIDEARKAWSLLEWSTFQALPYIAVGSSPYPQKLYKAKKA
jgi:hypothetical protein